MARKASGSLQAPKRSDRDVRAALRSWRLPAWWIAMVVAAPATSGLVAVEVFSGDGLLSQAIEDMVGPVKRFEILLDSRHDILEIPGLELLMSWVKSLRHPGLLWMGVP
eukprot:1943047-Lingulodinium_polyedra.AAC.1